MDEDSEIMIINTEGIIIRMKCSDISTYGRITSGVKLINLPDHDKVASVAKVRKASAEIDGEQVEIGEKRKKKRQKNKKIKDAPSGISGWRIFYLDIQIIFIEKQ